MEVNEKLEKYEGFINQLVEEKKNQIGTIISGPDADGYYRTDVQGSHILLKTSPEFKGKLEPEMEVVVIDEMFIHRILSAELKKVVEDHDFHQVDWSEIGGLQSQMQRIREAIEGPIKNKALYKDFGLDPMMGLLLYGPPGTGKTMIGKAIASFMFNKTKATKDHFVYIKGGEMLSKYVGEAEGNIKRLFANARELAKKTDIQPIIFIDEAEALLPERGSRQSSDVDKTIVPTFLAEMDGLNKNNPFVILSTNHPNSLDRAIVRPGRIDLKVKISRPTIEDSKEIFKIYFDKSLCKEKSEQLSEAAAQALFANEKCVKEVSGAYIKNVVQQTTMVALKRYADQGSKTPKGIITDDVLLTLQNA